MTQPLRMVKLITSVTDTCGVCGIERRCRHFDLDLNEALCPDCLHSMRQAEIFLLVWLIGVKPVELDASMADLARLNQPPGRLHWNSPGKKGAPRK